ncbi:sugar ABC transporter substrate-binding protein [Rhodospirillum rubrum]|uniref:ABC transporter substrate-binding protein n=1 Tax=Rhodospirillum rubrum TaxID=1085 RepID=UPI001906F46C|nr:ABC transporter substrate-binding protein [Rhodospirillum rubrum]MBK1664345.1 sugar ABC transporter substrate-binding protein [Rhodospirillum rubrum]MBK1676141.1 sugar ABC transporter substrate-binding protein [Rhodospirillum rubrum]
MRKTTGGGFGVSCLGALALVAGLAIAAPKPAAAGGSVEVLHWWTAGGEAKAVSALKDQFEAEGGTWIDSPVAGGGGDAAMTALRSRVIAGNPPSAVQLKGPSIQEWAAEGVVANLDDIAKAENWDKLLPALLKSVVTYEGHYVAVPVNIHRVDWLWANPAVLAKAGVAVPTTWDEFNTAAEALKAKGIIPLAHGGQPWQDATLFEVVVLGLGGPAFYHKALVELDDAALRGETMVKVFDQMRRLRGFVDPNFSGRDWNLATAMVINGEAAFQIMGDWAKGEFLGAGKVPGKDFLCIAAPGKGFLLNSDSLVMFDVKGADKIEGQKTLARLVLGEKFQRTFNTLKGSIPARQGMDLADFDACAQKSQADLTKAIAADSLEPSMAHEMAVPRSVRGAIMDVVTAHFNSSESSAEAVAHLADAIARAR